MKPMIDIPLIIKNDNRKIKNGFTFSNSFPIIKILIKTPPVNAVVLITDIFQNLKEKLPCK